MAAEMARNTRSTTNTLIVETGVFFEMIKVQKETSEKICNAVNQVRDAMKETKSDIDSLEVRVKALEDRRDETEEKKVRRVHFQLPPEAPSPPVVEEPLSSTNAFAQVEKQANGKYRCPRCFQSFAPSYIVLHMEKKNNRNCKPKP